MLTALRNAIAGRIGKTERAALAGDPLINEEEMRVLQHNIVEIAAQADTRPLYLIIKEGRLVVDPCFAARILDEAPYERQRKTYSHHVALLADPMRRNRWTAGTQLAFGWYGGRLHLVNGKHRMHAVIEAGRTIEFQVLIVDCDTEAELDALYYRFDVAQRKRSLSEILNGTQIAAEYKLTNGMTKATYEAVALIGNRLSRPDYQRDPVKARSVDARLDASRVWWPIAAMYEEAISPALKLFKKKLYTQGVVAVGLLTFKHQTAKAVEFWSGLANNDGLRKGDPRHTLITDLMNRRLNSGSSGQAAASAARAWNAYFDGRALKIIKVMPGSEVVVLGTPLDGRRS